MMPFKVIRGIFNNRKTWHTIATGYGLFRYNLGDIFLSLGEYYIIRSVVIDLDANNLVYYFVDYYRERV